MKACGKRHYAAASLSRCCTELNVVEPDSNIFRQCQRLTRCSTQQRHTGQQVLRHATCRNWPRSLAAVGLAKRCADDCRLPRIRRL